MSNRPAILVTGGAGYIGSHCSRALDAAGYQPVTYDNFSTGHRSFAAGTLVVGDIADKATLARTFAEHDIVAVMHFAASSLVGESVADPQKYYVNNLAGTLSLLAAMREAGCNRLVFSSTGAVYGNADSKALQGHVPDFAVFGDDYDTPDGTAIRDYIHVTDLAAAHVLALKLLLEGHSGSAFNLGTGNGFSVREILAAIAAETGREVPHVVKPRRSGDPTYLVADASAARATLKFSPAHSDLATIIRTAWAWHKKAHPLKTSEPVRDAA